MTSGHDGRRLVVVSHTYVEPTNREKWFAFRDLSPDWDITIVTPREWRDPQFGRRVSPPISESRLRVAPMASAGGSAGSYAFVTLGLAALLRRVRPSVIYVEAEPWSAVFLQVAAIRRFMSRASRLAVFSWWNTRQWTTPLRVPGSWAYATGLGATDLLIAGNHDAAELHREQGFTGPIEIVPQLGVDSMTHSPGPADDALRGHYGLDGRAVIGFVGRLTAPKGVDVLLTAAARLASRGWVLFIVGDGPERPRLRALADTLGIADRVVFAGIVSRQEMPRHMRLMDVLVLPSRKEQWEQFGHVLVEAMACGVPVVGSTSGEIPWVIGDERRVFPPGDAEALADRLQVLLQDRVRAAAARSAGLDRVKTLFTNAAIAGRLRVAFDRLLDPAGCAEPAQ